MWKVKELAGCEIVSTSGERIGVLDDVLPSRANDIWVIKTDLVKSKEIMLPALKDVVIEVNLIEKKIVVQLPQGLKEVFEEI